MSLSLAQNAAPARLGDFRRFLRNVTRRRVKNIGNGIVAGDRVGNWWQLNQDGTMEAGSSLTLSPQNSPGVSPITLNGSNQYYKSGNVAFPAADYSLVVVFNPTVLAGEVVAKWNGGDLVYTLEWSGGKPKPYITTTAGVTAGIDVSGITAYTTGVWSGAGFSYEASTGGLILTTPTEGGSVVVGAGGTFASSQPHVVGAHSGPGGFFAGLYRGAFFTEKILSPDDIRRIMAGAL